MGMSQSSTQNSPGASPLDPQGPMQADSPTNYSSPDDASQSVDSTVHNFQEENGRTYHGYRAGSYLYPNDSNERDRLDLQHVMLRHMEQTFHPYSQRTFTTTCTSS